MAQSIERISVEICAAQPTPEHAGDFAELANMASHDLMADLFGSHYRKVAASMFLRDDNLFSHRFSHFAIVDRNIAGLLYAFPQSQKQALNGKTSLIVMRSIGLRFPRTLWVQSRVQPLFSFMDVLPPDAFYIQCIAVYPQYRGQGISKLLLAKADELARQEQCRTVELDTETDNTVAINAYQGYGMEITATSPVIYSRLQQREIGLYRMVKRL